MAVYINPAGRSPCYGCGDRHLLCHTTCEDYLDFRKMADDFNAEQLKQNQIRFCSVDSRRHGLKDRTRGNRVDD